MWCCQKASRSGPEPLETTCVNWENFLNLGALSFLIVKARLLECFQMPFLFQNCVLYPDKINVDTLTLIYFYSFTSPIPLFLPFPLQFAFTPLSRFTQFHLLSTLIAKQKQNKALGFGEYPYMRTSAPQRRSPILAPLFSCEAEVLLQGLLQTVKGDALCSLQLGTLMLHKCLLPKCQLLSSFAILLHLISLQLQFWCL